MAWEGIISMYFALRGDEVRRKAVTVLGDWVFGLILAEGQCTGEETGKASWWIG